MELLNDIEAFLSEHDEISPTALGDRALGDRHFVRQVRAGRRVWPETEAKVRRFMADYEAGPPSREPPSSSITNPAGIAIPVSETEQGTPQAATDPVESQGRAPAAVNEPPAAAGATITGEAA
jgi:hypothetical protein